MLTWPTGRKDQVGNFNDPFVVFLSDLHHDMGVRLVREALSAAHNDAPNFADEPGVLGDLDGVRDQVTGIKA